QRAELRDRFPLRGAISDATSKIVYSGGRRSESGTWSGEIAHAGAGGVKFDATSGVSRVEDERMRGSERVRDTERADAGVLYIRPYEVHPRRRER
ncbi:hypothetical protein CVT25_007080, partial [Psilocybe cyanescens]